MEKIDYPRTAASAKCQGIARRARPSLMDSPSATYHTKLTGDPTDLGPAAAKGLEAT